MDGSVTAPTTTSVPKRSTGERTLVRSVIVMMLIVVATEVYSSLRMNFAAQTLRGELTKSEHADIRVSQQDVTKIVGGREPDDSFPVKAAAGEERYDVYYFSGLLARRTLCVHYSVKGVSGEDREVMEVITEFPPEVQAARKS